MHIEPGFVSPLKVMLANFTATGLLGFYGKTLIINPFEIIKVLLASVFFTVFMQSFHMSIGPSELHFVGAMVIYLTLGFTPTLFGFALGLTLQGMFFAPTDLPHLAVNSLSLILPLLLVHYTEGKKLFDNTSGVVTSWKNIIKLDLIYYTGVTTMVGFWLMIGEVQTPFAAWLSFASSYLAIVAIEPIISYTFIRFLKKHENTPAIENCFSVKTLTT